MIYSTFKKKFVLAFVFMKIKTIINLGYKISHARINICTFIFITIINKCIKLNISWIGLLFQNDTI